MPSALRPVLTSALLAVVSATCVVATGSSTRPAGQADFKALTVTLSAVTLADDCPDPHAAALGPAATTDASKMSGMALAQTSTTESSLADQRCEQTSMQLSLQATAGMPVTVRMKKVELLNGVGQKLADLTPRAPTLWSPDSTYKVWNEKVTSTQPLAVSYSLSAPNWATISGGRFQTFHLRVTVAVGAAERTMDKEILSAPQLPESIVQT